MSGQMERLGEIALDLVKKNNSDNDLAAERERTIKASLRAANKTIAILRSSCQDKHLLEFLMPEDVPASTMKTQRLDESTYIRDKMAVREAAAGLTGLFGDVADAEADI